ncbi:uncharacterized protein DUF3263 [Stackebrandtia albiflava]|uniref:Uncharacterized protein DUF3263 n=1 Tax=Stackebrandtia albiflava TaxID=406432 RepID=A0A562V1V2_9ACTN|nr:DUF3263 domain-containing protein [Stackebrandtia albiflava]TWJ11792.1 uncharacterized protein DUF3263 [Stackebrandtia albiflava]
MNRPPHTPLTSRQREILAFEARFWRDAGAKEQALRDELGMTETGYYQALARLLDEPAALEHSPALVNRLRRARDRRRGWRTATD